MSTTESDTTPTPEPLWTIEDVARFLAVSTDTLYYWRYVGTGPKAYRVGKHLRWDPREVRAWLEREAA